MSTPYRRPALLRPRLALTLITTLLACAACGTDDVSQNLDMAGGGDVDMRRTQPDIPIAPRVDMEQEPLDMNMAPDLAIEPDMGEAIEDMADAPDLAPHDMAEEFACRRPSEEDAPRFVVVSTPYDKDGADTTIYRVLSLGADGSLTDLDKTFNMGNARGGEIQFSPDGKIGVALQEDGSVGIFELDQSGNARVIKPSWKGFPTQEEPGGTLYGTKIVMSPSGDAVYMLNGGWRTAGGGVWRIPIDCQTGEPGREEFAIATKLPRGMGWLPGAPDTLLLAAHDALETMDRQDLHMITTEPMPTTLGTARVFADDDASISALGITPDGKYALLGDTNLFGMGMNNNRVGVISLSPDGAMAPAQTLHDIRDPASIETSPYGNAALVTSAEGNRIVAFSYDPSNAAAPFTNLGPMTTSSASLLPIETAQVERGPLQGTVLVTENTGVRTVAFQPDGALVEKSNFTYGEGIQHIVGALGVQP